MSADAPGQAPGQAEDRWEWRRRIRANPRHHRAYRIVVGVIGGLLLLLSVATGWLPGPGGIPLFLVGLAVLASEFEWAHRLLQRAKAEAHRFTAWSRKQPAWVRWSGGLLTIVGVLAAVWLFLVVIGVPGWTPDAAAGFLEGLPGIGS